MSRAEWEGALSPIGRQVLSQVALLTTQAPVLLYREEQPALPILHRGFGRKQGVADGRRGGGPVAQVVPMAMSGVVPGTPGAEERVHTSDPPLALAAQ